jgi:hypothetical protein
LDQGRGVSEGRKEKGEEEGRRVINDGWREAMEGWRGEARQGGVASKRPPTGKPPLAW